MESKTVVSSRGQVVIPKFIREVIGLHAGSQLFLSVRPDHVLELTPVHKSIQEFFGKGSASSKNKRMSLEDIDTAIAEAIIESNFSKD